MSKIAFDFDGVIAATDYLKKKWFKKNCVYLNNFDKYSIYQDLSKKMKIEEIDNLYNSMSDYVFSSGMLKKVKVKNDILRLIKKSYKKNELYIITSRPNSMIAEVKEWLENKKILKYFKEIISSSNSDKQLICKNKNIDILVDDDYRHLEKNIVKVRILISNTKRNISYMKFRKILLSGDRNEKGYYIYRSTRKW